MKMKFNLCTFLVSGLFAFAALAAEQQQTDKVARPNIVLKQLTNEIPKSGQHEIRILTATVAPGAASPWHTHASPPIVYITRGTLRLEMEGQPAVTLTRGQGFVESVGVVIRAVNPSNSEPAEVVIVQVSDPAKLFLDEVKR
jgi:quercetin dioxygenase-like cupin family protein